VGIVGLLLIAQRICHLDEAPDTFVHRMYFLALKKGLLDRQYFFLFLALDPRIIFTAVDEVHDGVAKTLKIISSA